MEIQKIEEEISNYYGSLNEAIYLGSGKIPARPKILSFYENVESFGGKLVDGGYIDQPYEWIFLRGIISGIKSQWDTIIQGTISNKNKSKQK